MNPHRDFDSTLGYPGEGPPEVGCECCPLGPAGRVQAKRPWAIDACGFCARPAQRNKWGYRCIECSTFWCDANCRDRHALTHRCRCRRQDAEARASPAQETETQDAALPPLPPPPLPPPMPDDVLPSENVPVEFEEPVMMPMLDGEVAEAGTGHAVEGRPAQRAAHGAALGAAAEILASTHEGTLLLRALASPAAETMIRIPARQLTEWRQC